jgi:hypothetical protein
MKGRRSLFYKWIMEYFLAVLHPFKKLVKIFVFSSIGIDLSAYKLYHYLSDWVIAVYFHRSCKNAQADRLINIMDLKAKGGCFKGVGLI